MKEEFLYYVWKYKLFTTKALKSTRGLPIEIETFGQQNFNAGPDFLNAKVSIDHQLWAGNVEMHLKSSDWYVHQHEKDDNYNAVVLHVVWEHDTEVFTTTNEPLPTLELKTLVDSNLLNDYKQLLYSKQSFIPCENNINEVDDFVLKNWLERLYFERLEEKANLIKALLKSSNYDFEAVLFQLLAKNFGLKINGEAFLQLAKSFDFSILRKVQHDHLKIEALLFGQSGFLDDEVDESYQKELQQEYNYLKHKFGLESLSKTNFQFFKMRPPNFPTVRIAQLSALYFQYKNVFSTLIEFKTKEQFYTFFKVKVDEFWETHFTFETKSKKTSKNLTKSFVDLLLINTIIPLKFVYLQHRGEAFEDEILNLIQQVASEKNSIISKFLDLKVEAKHAMDTQALLQLKNNYCTKKLCLQCAIGNQLLRK